MLKFCPACGTQREEAAAFCENCGHAFEGDVPKSAARESQTRPADGTGAAAVWSRIRGLGAQLGRSKRALLLGGVAVAVVAIAGAGFAFRNQIMERVGGADPDAPRVTAYDMALTPIRFGDKCGYVDEGGKLLINPQFEAAGFFDQASGLAPVSSGEKWGLIDRSGQYQVNPQFDALYPIPGAPIFAVAVGNKIGFVDREGDYLVNPQFDEVDEFDAQGRAMAGLGGKYGLINTTGQFVIAPQFDHLSSRHLPEGGVQYFSAGLARARLDDKWGFIDETGAWAINPQFVATGFFDAQTGLAPVEMVEVRQSEDAEAARNWELQQRSQEEQASYWGYRHTRPPRPVFTIRSEKRSWGFIDKTGKLVIRATFDEVGSFGESGLAPVRVGDKWGFIDANGAFKINPQFAGVGPFTMVGDGWMALAAMRTEAGEVRFGAIDSVGTMLFTPQFAELQAFDSDGTAPARMGDNWGLVNAAGRFVINPVYAQLGRIAGSRELMYVRSSGVQGGAGATEVGRVDRSGRVLSTVRGMFCGGEYVIERSRHPFWLAAASTGAGDGVSSHDYDASADAAAADAAAAEAAVAMAPAAPPNYH
jgi:hypothetical protein